MANIYIPSAKYLFDKEDWGSKVVKDLDKNITSIKNLVKFQTPTSYSSSLVAGYSYEGDSTVYSYTTFADALNSYISRVESAVGNTSQKEWELNLWKYDLYGSLANSGNGLRAESEKLQDEIKEKLNATLSSKFTDSEIATFWKNVNKITSLYQTNNQKKLEKIIENYASNYNSIQAKLFYEALGYRYTNTGNNVYTFGNSKNVYSDEYELPNFKDETQWLSGGLLRNEANAGGFLFTPTEVTGADEKPIINDEYHMLNGSLSAGLNTGFTEINSDVKGDFLDLFHDDELNVTTIVASVSITGSMYAISKEFEFTVTTNGGKSSVNYGAYGNYASMSTSEIANGYKSLGYNFATGEFQGLKVNISFRDLTKGVSISMPSMSLGSFMVASIASTMKSAFSSMLSSTISKSFNITSLNTMSLIGAISGLVVGELMERALGLDNSFGYGGEYDQKASNYFGVDSYGASKGFLGISSMIDNISYSLGITDSVSGNITNKWGGIIGNYYTADGYTSYGEIGDVTGYGYSQFTAQINQNLQSSINFANDYGLTLDEQMVEYSMQLEQFANETLEMVEQSYTALNYVNDYHSYASSNWGEQARDRQDMAQKHREAFPGYQNPFDNWSVNPTSGGGSPTGSGESSGLGIGNNRGAAGGFGSAAGAAAGGHSGGW